MQIQMVDLKGQYLKIKEEIDQAISEVIDSTRFIGGPIVNAFSEELAAYLDCKYVVPCANGTDALQLALMSLELPRHTEIIVPAFTYVATAEVIALLGLKPIMVDAEPGTFNIDIKDARKKLTSSTKAIVPVHLFGQCSNMEAVMAFAREHDLYVIEDNAQAIGADYIHTNGSRQKAGTIGHIGCTSFFPSKNLGCYGDGGALMTNDDELYAKIKMIANHGQSKKYHHQVIGVNSRLDAMQAAILRVKLRHLDDYCDHRRWCADQYDQRLGKLESLVTPYRAPYSTHVFHQYTLQVKNGKRDALKEHLAAEGIPSMIYYPLPLYRQAAFQEYHDGEKMQITESHCAEVLSLPIDTELDQAKIDTIADSILSFYN